MLASAHYPTGGILNAGAMQLERAGRIQCKVSVIQIDIAIVDVIICEHVIAVQHA